MRTLGSLGLGVSNAFGANQTLPPARRRRETDLFVTRVSRNANSWTDTCVEWFYGQCFRN